MRIAAVIGADTRRIDPRGLWPPIRTVLERSGASLEMQVAAGRGDAARLARGLANEGFDLILAIGGDGVIADVADGILRSMRSETAFSFVPAGRGSDFVRNFVLPETAEAYVDRLLSAPLRPLDAGLMTCEGEDGQPLTRHFVNAASFGLSGSIARAVGRARRSNWPLPAALSCHSALQLLSHRPRSVRLRLDGAAVYDGPITAVTVTNSGGFMAGMKVDPAASASGRAFDVVIVRGGSRLSSWQAMRHLRDGAHLDHRLVSIHRAQRVEAWPGRGSPDFALVEGDGKAAGRVPVRFDILPAALNLKI